MGDFRPPDAFLVAIAPVVFMRVRAGELPMAWILRATGALERLSREGEYADHPNLSRDLRAVVYSRHKSTLVRLDLLTMVEEVLDERRCSHPTLSPVTGRIAFVEHSPTGPIQHLGQGADASVLPPGSYNAVDLGDAVLYHQRAGEMAGHVAIREGGAVHHFPDGGRDRRPSVSPDGAWLTWQRTIDGQERIVVCARQGGPIRVLAPGPWNDEHPWFSRDGEWILHGSDRTGVREIWATHRGSEQALRATDGDGYIQSAVPRT